MERGIFLACTNCTDPSRHEEFNRWYGDVHLPQLRQTPGLVQARRFTNAFPTKTPSQYLALYDFESESVVESVGDLRRSARGAFGHTGKHPCLDAVGQYVYAEISPSEHKPPERVAYPPKRTLPSNRLEPSEAKPLVKTLPRAVYMILTNCTDPVREEEFNRWYSHVHVPDLRPARGMVSATRYRAAGPGLGPAAYLARYEFETPDLEMSLGDVRRLAGAARENGRSIDCLDPVAFWLWLQIDGGTNQED